MRPSPALPGHSYIFTFPGLQAGSWVISRKAGDLWSSLRWFAALNFAEFNTRPAIVTRYLHYFSEYRTGETVQSVGWTLQLVFTPLFIELHYFWAIPLNLQLRPQLLVKGVFINRERGNHSGQKSQTVAFSGLCPGVVLERRPQDTIWKLKAGEARQESQLLLIVGPSSTATSLEAALERPTGTQRRR